MPIFVGANGIIPELFYNWHNFWTIFHIYRNIFPMQIFIELIQMAKINVHELLKYCFDFYLCPIFSESNMSIFLDPFGEIFIWVIFKNDSEGSTNPHFKFK